MSYAYQSALPFDEMYAWVRFISQLDKAKQGEIFVFYQWDRKFRFQKISKERVRIIQSERLKDLIKSSKVVDMFEGQLMSSVLKDTQKHVHIYKKSPRKAENWMDQTYHCLDPDCRHYDRAENLVGKRAKCGVFGCSEFIVIDAKQLKKRRSALVCVGCTKSPAAATFNAARTAINDVLDLCDPVEIPELDENELNLGSAISKLLE